MKILTNKEKETLNKLGLSNLNDVLTYFPYRYELIEKKAFKDWLINEQITFEGIIISKFKISRYGNKSIIRFDVRIENNEIVHCSIFNRIWISKIKIGTKLTLFGKYDGYNKVTLINYNLVELDKQIGYQPVYYLKEGVTNKYLRNIIRKALINEKIYNLIPEDLVLKYKLIDRKTALENIHFPKDKQLLDNSLRTLKYEEFLIFELLINLKRKDCFIEDKSYIKSFDNYEVFKLQNDLSFTLTLDQVKAINDILDDLAKPFAMNRLIQGDVGCGKTCVAAFGLYANFLSKKQGVLMVPTEILAIQQFEEFKNIFKNKNINIACLYSSLDKSKKNDIINDLNSGKIDIVIGTHSLIQENISFNNLGLIVTDEQHRFGVSQRAKLKKKGAFVDVLVMSATPIPRTIASVLYGDTSISYIHNLPKERKPVITKLINSNSFLPIYNELCQKLDSGSRVYIVCPSIDENDELRNVEMIYKALSQEFNNRYQIGFIHGHLDKEEKSEVMNNFKMGKIQILVCTTIIEVGINVKEANVMVIYNSERFGLSQLHQLRGRIKRGNLQGYCYLLTSCQDENSLTRLNALVNNEDGFEIADIDLKLRGPGDLLGTKQSGLPSFKIGNFYTDSRIIKTAYNDATDIINNPEKYLSILNYCENYLNNLKDID